MSSREPMWKWYVCGMLLLATMLNYMDRQTLPQVATDIRTEFAAQGESMSDEAYGTLEMGFGLAFATGALVFGVVVDRVGVRWMYPTMLVGWSAAGFATAWVESYRGLLACRVALGLFEAGHWPCALTVSQRMLTLKDRTLGNSILQSGAAIGAILTPLTIQLMLPGESGKLPNWLVAIHRALEACGVHWSSLGTWRAPFQVIGLLGCLWIVPWFLLIGRGEFDGTPDESYDDREFGKSSKPEHGARASEFARRFATLLIVVIMINMYWHFFRAWMPKFLREYHQYGRTAVNLFTSAYYISADLGCLTAGFLTRRLVAQGWPVHRSRLTVFTGCALLASLSLLAARLPAGNLLLGVLLVIGFGALGLFPNYYSFTQDLSSRHQGKISGVLGCTTWVCSAFMHPVLGRHIDTTHSYAMGLFLMGFAPLVAVAAIAILWNFGSVRSVNRGKGPPP